MPPVGLPSNPRGRVGTSPFTSAATSTKSNTASPLPRPNRAISSPHTRVPSRQIQETQPQYSTRQATQLPRATNVYADEYAPRRSRDSDSSGSSSSGSSIWAREAASQRSSRTTLQSYDGDNEYKDVSTKDSAADVSSFNVDTGHVWSRVTEAASVITGVGKVLASGLASYNAVDEDEPDDHLMNVLRAYHLAKAESPSELPDWLFSERERRLAGFQRREPQFESQGRDDSYAQSAEMGYRRDIRVTQHSERSFERRAELTPHHENAQVRGFGDRLRDVRRIPGGPSFPSRRQ
ncbi:hypothetical protein CVT24_007625 [Panaeolus cyanescens]|uniref:Uncharacterized protein n=1 Tax=Panaeolus cyanescens TaxID=181874 RepID=A0A409WYY7_9AGAR|nr:hypothetical protein CVT24_007625 [Panaeolus cyanescens]